MTTPAAGAGGVKSTDCQTTNSSQQKGTESRKNVTDTQQQPEDNQLTLDDVIYWMGWHMDSQRRIYDALCLLIAVMSKDEYATELVETHERGEFLYPPPWVDNDDS